MINKKPNLFSPFLNVLRGLEDLDLFNGQRLLHLEDVSLTSKILEKMNECFFLNDHNLKDVTHRCNSYFKTSNSILHGLTSTSKNVASFKSKFP